MKFGHRIIGKVEEYDDRGRGILHLNDEKHLGYNLGKGEVAIPFSAVGDEVSATFIRRDHGMKIARLEEITTPSPDRVAPACPHAGTCGGCLWQHLAYDKQVVLKQQMIEKAFERAGHAEKLERIVPALEHFHQRNRMDYVIGWTGAVGLKEYDAWNRFVDLKTCLLLDADVGAILHHVREWMKACDLQPWDNKHYVGDIRYCVIREGKRTKQRMIILVVSSAERITTEMRKQLQQRMKEHATTLLIGEQPEKTDLSYAKTFESIFGEAWIEEDVNQLRYRIHPNSFFQTNSGMAEQLQSQVLDLVDLAAVGAAGSDHVTGVANQEKRTVLDLYCGLGFFGIAVAKRHPDWNIHGFEIDTEAIQLAHWNAERNGVASACHFVSGPAEDLSWQEIPADMVILDPPRAGLHPRVLKTLLEKQPREIIYISCNYHRLVEELKLFKEKYEISSLMAMDLFPHTPHVEVIVSMRLK